MRAIVLRMCALVLLLSPIGVFGQSADSLITLRRLEYEKQIAIRSRAIRVILPDSSLAVTKILPSVRSSMELNRNWIAKKMGSRLSEEEFWTTVGHPDIASIARDRHSALQGQKLMAAIMFIGGSCAAYQGWVLLTSTSDKDNRSGYALLVGAFWLNVSAPFVYYDAVVKMRTRLAPYGVAKDLADEYNRTIMLEFEKKF